jgi:UDP-N-acetylmuramoyl-tripeptide--D-alanyl-D-alanine ligase
MKQAKLTIKDLFNLPGSVIYNPDSFKPIKHVTIDSRDVKKGSLFVAIKGEKFDGHDFVKEALNNGALAVVIENKSLNRFMNLKIPFIAVQNTSKSLGDIAKVWRTKLDTKIIGLTGSAGKTTTKEIIAKILSEKFKVNKTIANNNNHIGVPLTLLSTNNRHDALVLELGTNHFGEIAYTAKIAQPDYALITNIGNSHLEFLKNKKGVLKEKIALLDTTESRKGVLFINNDDPMLRNEFADYKNRITYGFTKGSKVHAEIKNFTDDGKPVIKIGYKNKSFALTFPLYGEQSAKNYVAAAAVALELGLSKEKIVSGTKKLKPVNKRLNVRRFRHFILIDDTYNANPESMKYAIELMTKMKVYKNKTAVLGDMFELGKEAIKLHESLGSVIKKNGIDNVLTIGKSMKYLSEKLATQKINSIHFSDKESLNDYLKEFDFKKSVVLVKGSRGMKMEDFVKTIESRAND